MHTGFYNDLLYTALQVKSEFIRSDGKTELRPGTAFFVQNKLGKLCLVTNRHMLEFGYKKIGNENAGYLLNKIIANVKIKDSKSNLPNGNKELEINFESNSIKFHPDDNNDLGVIIEVKAKPITTNSNTFIDFFIPHNLIASNKYFEESLTICDFVAFPGFPKGHDSNNGNPIIRVGTIASDPRIDYSFQNSVNGSYLLYEAFSFGGSSGSPVFSFSKQTSLLDKNFFDKFRIMLIGVNVGHIPNDSSDSHSGLSYFVKSSTILELIDSDFPIKETIAEKEKEINTFKND